MLAERPLIDVECDSIEPTLLDTLVSHIATVASVSYLPPVPVARPGLVHEEDIEEYRSVPSEQDLEKIQEGDSSIYYFHTSEIFNELQCLGVLHPESPSRARFLHRQYPLPSAISLAG